MNDTITDKDLLDILKKKCLSKKNGLYKFQYLQYILNYLDIINDTTKEIVSFVNDSQLFINGLPRYNTDYCEIKKIGKGGFGDVFVSQNCLDKHFYAIKKINISIQDTNQLSFNEIYILSTLSHPNIVRYYCSWIEPFHKKNGQNNSLLTYTNYQIDDISHKLSYQQLVDEGQLIESSDEEQEFCSTLYIQMELCQCYTLQHLLINNKFTYSQIIYIIAHLIQAIKYLHEHDIIHRDIKPNNILFDTQNVVKLSDFGLSTFIHNNHSHLTSSQGYVLYKDPYSNNKMMDIYSLGVIITELFSQFNTQMEKIDTLHKLKENILPSHLDKEIRHIILLCIHKDIQKRYTIFQLEKYLNESITFYPRFEKLNTV